MTIIIFIIIATVSACVYGPVSDVNVTCYGIDKHCENNICRCIDSQKTLINEECKTCENGGYSNIYNNFDYCYCLGNYYGVYCEKDCGSNDLTTDQAHFERSCKPSTLSIILNVLKWIVIVAVIFVVIGFIIVSIVMCCWR